MKASSKGRVRPTILFSQTPHSVSRRAKLLSNRTAAELLRHLCELTIGFGRGFVDLTYRALAESLHKDWRTIARAASLLRATGDVEVEVLENRSYRWYVLLEAEDIVADPERLYRVRSAQTTLQPGQVMAETPWGSWHERHGGHDKNAMGVMTKTPCRNDVENSLSEPCFIRAQAASEGIEKDALKIDLKDTSLKIHHQNERDDEAPEGHKGLLRRLLALGTGQRMARKLLSRHDHQLIASALERVSSRSDLENPAGYLIREVEDGGYQESAEFLMAKAPAPITRSREKAEAACRQDASTAVGVEQTREEQKALEADRQRKEHHYQTDVRTLLDRFQTLTEDLKQELKQCWTRHLDALVPNTPKKAMLMEEQRFQKIAFKEVTGSFFALLDQGFSTDHALAQLAA